MTTELQAAMARYEAARGGYRTAVLRSIGGTRQGPKILAAIRECQAARIELRRLSSRAEGSDPTQQAVDLLP
jgi:hypothetical protein